VKHFVNSSQIKTIELSCRYENLNCDLKRNGSIKQSLMPVFSVQFGEESFMKLETGIIIDHYNVSNNKDQNSTRFVCQIKARF
jgi:hypothetical protein